MSYAYFVYLNIQTIFRGAVFAGIHHIPLLKGKPSDDIIEKLSYLPLDFIVKKFKSDVKVFVSIWINETMLKHFKNVFECSIQLSSMQINWKLMYIYFNLCFYLHNPYVF